MTHPVVGIAALVIFVMCWRKFGFRKATFWGCGIVSTFPAFAFTGMFIPSILRFFGVSPAAVETAGVILIAAATITAKYKGWGKVLLGMFQVALVLCAFTILGIMAVLLFALANGAR
jgi:hypothetical protein